MPISARSLASRVRLKVGIEDNSKLRDKYIWELASSVQNNIFARIRPPTTFSISLVNNQTVYPFPDENTIDILSVQTSWNGNITFFPITEFNATHSYNSSGSVANSYPVDASIFGRQIYLWPYPTSSGTITFFARQIATNQFITEGYDSSLPSWFDRALIYGTCAEIDPVYIPLYEKEIEDIGPLTNLGNFASNGVESW